MSCTNNLKQIGLAMHNYHDAYQPASRTPAPTGRTSPAATRPPASGWTWMYHITPFIEQDNVYKEPDRRGRRGHRDQDLLLPVAPPADAVLQRRPVRLRRQRRPQHGRGGARGDARCGSGSAPGLPTADRRPARADAEADRRHRRPVEHAAWSARSSATRPCSARPAATTRRGTTRAGTRTTSASARPCRSPTACTRRPPRPTFWSVRFGGSHTGGFTAAMGDGSVRFIRYGSRCGQLDAASA